MGSSSGEGGRCASVIHPMFSGRTGGPVRAPSRRAGPRPVDTPILSRCAPCGCRRSRRDAEARRRSACWNGRGRGARAPPPRAGSARPVGRRRTPWPAAVSTAFTASPSSRPARNSSRSTGARSFAGRGSMGRPSPNVGGRRRPRRAAPYREVGRRSAAGSPTVEALVMEARDRSISSNRRRGESRSVRYGWVRTRSCSPRTRAGLVPDPGGNTECPDRARRQPADENPVGRREPEVVGGGGCQPCDSAQSPAHVADLTSAYSANTASTPVSWASVGGAVVSLPAPSGPTPSRRCRRRPPRRGRATRSTRFGSNSVPRRGRSISTAASRPPSRKNTSASSATCTARITGSSCAPANGRARPCRPTARRLGAGRRRRRRAGRAVR